MADGSIADSLRRTVRRDEIGMSRFEILESLQYPVVLEVTDLRRCQDVILLVMNADFLP